MASDNSGFKSLTEWWDNAKDEIGDWFGQHFATVEKPQDTTYQSSKAIALGIGVASGVGGCYYVENAIMLRQSAVLSSMGIPLPSERTVKKMSRAEVRE